MEEVSEYYHLAHQFAINTNRNLFITGKAGTGKTTFLHQLRQETKKQMAVVAPTGVAAINAGGTTIHSLFQLPLTPFIPTAEGRKHLFEQQKMSSLKRKVIQELELLVIDEVSMVRADLLDEIDAVLRHVRYKNNEVFGGVQVILIGDMFQLPPVIVEDEWRHLAPYYKSPYFFHAQALTNKELLYIELDKIFRQTNANFIRVLNEVRNSCLSPEGYQMLQKRFDPLFIPPNDDTYITLTTHNYKADQINSKELALLGGKSWFFEAIVRGEFPEKTYPTDKNLELKVGAKVMFIKNDDERPRRFYNGKIGVIKKITDECILIKSPDDDEDIELRQKTWENIRFETNESTLQIKEEIIGTFSQFPLRLAWAITIHKSQGLTFDKVVIDAGAAFATGQVYVALSRCRSLEGIVLWSKINPDSISTDRVIVEYEQHKPLVDELEYQLNKSREEFKLFVLQQLFDFRTAAGQIQRLKNDFAKVASSFNDETPIFISDIERQLAMFQDVALKFQNQLTQIITTLSDYDNFLSERLLAASKYFDEKTTNLLESINLSPAVTDSRDNARSFNSDLRNIFGFIAQKQHIFRKLQTPFAVENYFTLKNSFAMPEFTANSYSKTVEYVRQDVKNIDLYHQLIELRNRLCEPQNLPIYIVAGSKTLLELTEYLPLTERDLLRITGFGQAKVEKYGSEFLKIISDYCQKHNITSNIDALKSDKRQRDEEKKEKKPKGETQRLSYQMYKDGKKIEEIAAERKLTVGTICTHLAMFANLGLLEYDDFISKEKLAKAHQLAQETSEYSTMKAALDSILTPVEFQFFVAWNRQQKKESQNEI
ncbi:MAG: AAA family ATPase [Paludibacter sp.]|jgi:GTPase SAR1 family protein|nr:AAA family ATPase [Paludibacter sp.]